MENWIAYNTTNKNIFKYKNKLLEKYPDNQYQHEITRFLSIMMSITSILAVNMSYYLNINLNDVYMDGVKIKKIKTEIKIKPLKSLDFFSINNDFKFLKIKSKLKTSVFSELDKDDYGDVVKSTCYSYLSKINLEKEDDLLKKDLEEELTKEVLSLIELYQKKYINKKVIIEKIPVGNTLFEFNIKFSFNEEEN